MGRRWVGPRGWDVELISLDGRPMLRARQHGVLSGYYATPQELQVALGRARLSIADLVEALSVRTRATSRE